MYGHKARRPTKFNAKQQTEKREHSVTIEALQNAFSNSVLELRGFRPSLDKCAVSTLVAAAKIYETLKRFDDEMTFDSHCDVVLSRMPFYVPLNMTHLACVNAETTSARFGRARRRSRALMVMHEVENSLSLVPVLGKEWVLTYMKENNAAPLSLYVYGQVFGMPSLCKDAFINDNGKTESLVNVVQALTEKFKFLSNNSKLAPASPSGIVAPPTVGCPVCQTK